MRLDLDPVVSPDYVADICDMVPVRSGSMDALWSSHNIEHLYPHDVPRALAEFHRVLKEDGVLAMALPDIQRVAQFVAVGMLEEPLYSSPAGPICAIDMIYGHRPSMAAGNLFMAHHTGFTPGILEEALETAGFAFGALKRQAYMEVSALAFKSASNGTGRHDRILAELEF